MPKEAVEATNEVINGIIEDAGLAPSEQAREATADRFKRRQFRPKELARSGRSFRAEAGHLEHLVKVEKLPGHLDVGQAKARIQDLRHQSYEVSQARVAVNELVVAWSR